MQLHNTSSKFKCHRSPGVFAGTVTGCRKPVRCGQWKCPHCKWVLFFKFKMRACSVKYDWMITLTSPFGLECGTLKREDLKLIHARAREFRRLFRNNIGPIEAWTWACEIGPCGQKLHVHMLLKVGINWLEYSDLHELADRAGLPSWRHFDRGDYADYGLKYLTKDIFDAVWPHYARRCMTSIPKPVFTPLRFEPLRFIPIDNCETTEHIDESTGEVFKIYSGPSYIPMDSSLPREFFAKLPDDWSALPYLGSAAEPTPEWGQMVADCDPCTAQPTLSPNCFCSLYLIHTRDSVEGQENVK